VVGNIFVSVYADPYMYVVLTVNVYVHVLAEHLPARYRDAMSRVAISSIV
jgi:hypothetical protein